MIRELRTIIPQRQVRGVHRAALRLTLTNENSLILTQEDGMGRELHGCVLVYTRNAAQKLATLLLELAPHLPAEPAPSDSQLYAAQCPNCRATWTVEGIDAQDSATIACPKCAFAGDITLRKIGGNT